MSWMQPTKFIVTTTIRPPTKATLRFANMKGWKLMVVGDKKTPHHIYRDLNCVYLHPDDQELRYPELSEAIGWNTIQRRNIGLIEAFKEKAPVIATVDDDNIPYDDWGKDLYVGKEIDVDCYRSEKDVFDPLSVTNHSYLWHRGYPIEYLQDKNKVHYAGKIRRRVLVQADLWDGDPDVDAMARMTFKPCVKFDVREPFCSSSISPFNSQNTFLSREVIPYYAVFPHVGRMDDIWGGYFLQFLFPGSVIYNRASVYQERHEQDVVTNLEREVCGYRNTLKLLHEWGIKSTKNQLREQPTGTSEEVERFYKLYRKAFQ